MAIETLNLWLEETRSGAWPRPEKLYKVKGDIEDYIKVFDEFKDVGYM
jgi:hypothetical protein